ncbi:TerB family tellurite resistance protein [Lentibacter sp.]|uniref:tellurite resistance TerB family protein n=1 Tax=Lentibacter sp. TaxID=2024994 RepID=UPI003F69B719
MIKGLFERLLGAADSPATDADARLALTALLVRVARADFVYDASEQAQIDKVIARRYALSPAETEALRQEAETLEAEAPDTVRFTRAIKDAVPYDERIAVVEALWSVVLADQARDEHEDALLRMVANLLGVSDRDSNLARQRASGA